MTSSTAQNQTCNDKNISYQSEKKFGERMKISLNRRL